MITHKLETHSKKWPSKGERGETFLGKRKKGKGGREEEHMEYSLVYRLYQCQSFTVILSKI